MHGNSALGTGLVLTVTGGGGGQRKKSESARKKEVKEGSLAHELVLLQQVVGLDLGFRCGV